jgi:hypothetical protein
MAEQIFSLRSVPLRLMRSLLLFAGAGSLMAGLVFQDGGYGRVIPTVMLLACWSIPLAFWVQIRRDGYDPLTKLVATDAGLEAHAREGGVRFIPWPGMQRLVQVEGFRQRFWSIETDETPLRWFGELVDPDGFAALVAERTGKAWELEAS